MFPWFIVVITREIGPHLQPPVVSLLFLQEKSVAAKHVNTCSSHVGAVSRVDLRVIIHHYIDRGHLCELNSVKIIVSSGLEVAIINVHVFAHQPDIVY